MSRHSCNCKIWSKRMCLRTRYPLKWCPRREIFDFLNFFIFSVSQLFGRSVSEVCLVGLDVSVLLEQLEALLDGLQESKRYLFTSLCLFTFYSFMFTSLYLATASLSRCDCAWYCSACSRTCAPWYLCKIKMESGLKEDRIFKGPYTHDVRIEG